MQKCEESSPESVRSMYDHESSTRKARTNVEPQKTLNLTPPLSRPATSKLSSDGVGAVHSFHYQIGVGCARARHHCTADAVVATSP